MKMFHALVYTAKVLQKEYGGTVLEHLELHLDLYLLVKKGTKDETLL